MEVFSFDKISVLNNIERIPRIASISKSVQ
jgi:hypothetical protein